MIYGAGGTSSFSSIALLGLDKDVLFELGRNAIPIAGYFALQDKRLPLKWLGTHESINDLSDETGLLISCEDAELSHAIYTQHHDKLVTYISPDAMVAESASIGLGSLIQARSYLSHNVTIGHCCKINVGAQIHHDARLGNFSICAPNATLLGAVNCGDECFIGAGALVRENTRIGDRAIVGMGAVVVSDVMQVQTVAGNPAKPL